jgi:solute carrier family 35 protein C2
MDGNKDDPGEEAGQAEYPWADSPSREAGSRRSTSVSSLDSQDSALGTDADDPPSDMDSAGDAYRRRRAQMMAGLGNGSVKGNTARKHPRKHRHGTEDKHLAYSSDDGQASDFSFMSTSDDVELSHLASEDALTDDEETGLTKRDKEHRKRKRRRNTRLDGRIAGNARSSKQGNEDADRNVIKAMIINVLLIISWYIFSLSISIVG